MIKILPLCFASIIVLVGCFPLPAPYVSTSTTTFQGENHGLRGTIAVAPIDKSQQDSLEFKAISAYITKKLLEQGYSAANNSAPQFVAYVTYGIDSGKTTISSIPMVGQTSGGSTISSGTFNVGGKATSYSGAGYTMPTYGLVGSMIDSDTEYKRAFNLDIFQNIPNQKPNKVYEIKAVSTGTCGNINSVIYIVIDSAFKNFPGENGKTKRINADWPGNC